MQETTDIASALLAMKSDNDNNENDIIKEEQYISKVLASLSTNDLKSFKKHLEKNYDKVKEDISSIKYGYSVEPQIYGIDSTEKIVKLSPSNLFSSNMVGMNMMSSYTSIYSQMLDDKETINNSYDIIAGRLPEKYNEMIIVLAEKTTISDLLVYSLGFRNSEELTDIVTKIMSGEKVELNNEALELTYDDLMNKELKLIMPSDLYKYNSDYDIYEDMSEDEEYMKELYENAVNLKIVGIITAKDGVTTTALNPGVSYTSSLIDYIIENSAKSDIVKKQKENEEVDVLSSSRFDETKKGLDINFTDLVSIDSEKLKNSFNIKLDRNQLQNETQGYMNEISNAISIDITPAKNDFTNNLNIFAKEILNRVNGQINENEIDGIVSDYLNEYEPSKQMSELEAKHVIPKDVYKTTYSGLLKGLLQLYIQSYESANSLMSQMQTDTNNFATNEITNTISANDAENAIQPSNNELVIPEGMLDTINSLHQDIQNMDVSEMVLKGFLSSAPIQETCNTMARAMTEAVIKKTILTKVGELTSNLTSSFASSFNVDQDKIASAFQMKMTEDEITRIVKSMLTETEANARVNLIKFGFQEKDEPTYISFYFKSFDGKEHFIDFLDSYNDMVKNNNENDKEINYIDATGILMGSVKTIVNAVTYVLIAFISISLVVSSIMIGIITYISVYERTKEIGILRAIGASKRNISSTFNAETFIIGLLSGLFGIGITYISIPIINNVLHHFIGNIPLNATFYINNALFLVVLSVILTLIGGLIPAKAASKKDPVIALRTE